MALVAFVKEGNKLDDKATEQACKVLYTFWPGRGRRDSYPHYLIDSIPTFDGSCPDFIESIMLLLTSSNEKLIKTTLSVLEAILRRASPIVQLSFLGTGSIKLLQQALFEQERFISPSPEFHLMKIVKILISDLHPRAYRTICEEGPMPKTIYQQTLLLLQNVRSSVIAWLNESPSVHKRGKQILAKMCEEGLSDSIEHFIRHGDFDYSQYRYIFLGVLLIHMFGGNAPF
ncbi:hypothetical protein BLNAU_1590 [Blattamonas nauphoetae]|uniref:Uncharacterized protein n=1 Tax=Blattamonas nauphoetae TaxID=2049346 RepID=A0ABQ9YIF5_9EUKA|nr:hypothetical protein BLNAU_1590 [Blattamonas nauphoetae]